jgi:single-strand DNA-binding protein
MTDIITLTGLVATSPRHITTSEGLAITSFRLASNQRRFDRGQNAWVDGDTNWYTVTAFRQLGVHVASSIEKGQRVIVTGRVRVRDWESGEKSGTTVEIDAEAIGHDLTWGRASFTRSVVTASSTTGEGSPEPEAAASAGDDAEGTSAAPAEADSDRLGERVAEPVLAGAGTTPPF